MQEMNMLDYIDWRGDLSMIISPFNEVDNLILSEIAYANFDNIVEGLESEETITLQEAGEKYNALERGQGFLGNNPSMALNKAAESERFRKIRLGYYEKEISAEQEFQFTAVTFFLEDGTVYVAYKGTDNSIAGWREDFNFVYLKRTEGQNHARNYLTNVCIKVGRAVRVGGHSKGGNLAVYAAAFCEEKYKDQIISVYSNDGPGFNPDVVQTSEYQGILSRVQMFIPEFSVVGILLSNKNERKIIDSNGLGVKQHNPYTWQVLGTKFQEAGKQTLTSIIVEETFSKWFDSLNREQAKELISVIFNLLEATGADTFTEIKGNKRVSFNALVKAMRGMDNDTQKLVTEGFNKLLSSSWESITEEMKKAPNKIKETLASDLLDRRKEL